MEGIRIDDEVFIWVEIRAKDGIGDGCLYLVEGCGLSLPPDKKYSFLGQLGNWLQNFCAVGDVVLYEIYRTKEPTYFLDVVRLCNF